MNLQSIDSQAVRSKVDAEYPSAAHVKRFLEVWCSGLYKKEDLLTRPQEILDAHHVAIDPSLISVLFESKFLRGKSGKFDLLPPQFDAFRDFMMTKIQWRQQIRTGSAPADPIFREFRERQIQRCEIELGSDQNTAIVHTPVVFELTRGCSVKCWFCALDAPPLTGIFDYSPENTRFFRDVLRVVKDVIGPASKWASSYWGTDPLDNPDQEKFSLDFREILGMYPQTTTAIPLRAPERTRKLLEVSHASGCLVNRFSVRTPAQLRKIHDTFSAEELLYTELVLQNLESDSVKARAGRLIHFADDLPKLAAKDEEKLLNMLQEREPELAAKATSILINLPGSTEPIIRATSNADEEDTSEEYNVSINVPGTTSCLTGFKINMVDRTVELLSPCPANERWPLGHIVFEEGTFDTAEDLRTLMLGMISRNMAERVVPESLVRFVPRLIYREDPEGFRLGSVFGNGVICHDPTRSAYLHRLGNLLREGKKRAGEIAMLCFYEFGVPENYTMGSINNMFHQGIIAEEPIATEAPIAVAAYQ